MGVFFTEIDTSDGVVKRHAFNINNPGEQIVMRFTIEVSKDLTDRGIAISTPWMITRMTDNKVVMTNPGLPALQTNPGDMGGYVIWYDPIPAGTFYPVEIYKFQVFAGGFFKADLSTSFLVPSPEWFFYVGPW